MKKDNFYVKWLRIVLGIFLILFALNRFLHFVPLSYGHMSKNAEAFIDSTVEYLPYLYIFEIIIGLLLILNKWSAFIYIMLTPLTIAFLIFSITNKDFNNMLPALFVAVFNVILLFSVKEKYKVLFT
jgi:hypothetical protein